MDEGYTGISIPLFQIITPNMVNNIDLEPLWYFYLFAMAISQLKGCDLVFDSYMNEFELGKAQNYGSGYRWPNQMGTDGTTNRYLIKTIALFYAIPGDRENSGRLILTIPEIRADSHDKGITKALTLLSFKCGMGTGI